MKVFQSKGDGIRQLRGSDENEKAIQELIEHNLPAIFPDLELLRTEYTIDDLRPDSVVFDKDKKSFVIIEYKKLKHKGVVDQGMSYYNLFNERKERFVLLYQEVKNTRAETDQFNWDESRIIFISPEFTKHQKRASQSVSLPIELYEIAKYEDGIILFNKIQSKRDPQLNDRPAETRTSDYTEDDYLKGEYTQTVPSEQIRDLYYKLKNRIQERFPDTEVKQRKKYVGFYLQNDGSAICTIALTKNNLRLGYSTTKPGVIPIDSFVKDYKDKGHWGIGNYLSDLESDRDLDRAIDLIGIVYNLKSQTSQAP